MKGALAKASSFCRLEMLPLHLRGCFNVGKSDIEHDVVLPAQRIISKSFIYLLMLLRI